MKKTIFTILFFTVFCSFLFGISIRGNSTRIISAGLTERDEIQFYLNDLVVIDLNDNPFIEGLEFTITLPVEYINYRNSFAVTVYTDLTSRPDISIKRYTGKKVFFDVLPPVRKMYLDIPIRKLFSGSVSPGTYSMKEKISPERFPVVVKIEPVMKGIPSSLLEKVFKLKVSSKVTQKGSVTINVDTGESNKSYSVHIDKKPVDPDKDLPLLAPGIHQLKISSDYYEEYISNFAVKAGQTTTLSVTLKPYLPTVQFDFPEGSVIFLDGEKVSVASGIITPISRGEHVVRITIGDYNLSKKFTVQKDKNYKISLFLDIFVKEN